MWLWRNCEVYLDMQHRLSFYVSISWQGPHSIKNSYRTFVCCVRMTLWFSSFLFPSRSQVSCSPLVGRRWLLWWGTGSVNPGEWQFNFQRVVSRDNACWTEAKRELGQFKNNLFASTVRLTSFKRISTRMRPRITCASRVWPRLHAFSVSCTL